MLLFCRLDRRGCHFVKVSVVSDDELRNAVLHDVALHGLRQPRAQLVRRVSMSDEKTGTHEHNHRPNK